LAEKKLTEKVMLLIGMKSNFVRRGGGGTQLRLRGGKKGLSIKRGMTWQGYERQFEEKNENNVKGEGEGCDSQIGERRGGEIAPCTTIHKSECP